MKTMRDGIIRKKPGNSRKGGRWDNPGQYIYGFRFASGGKQLPVWIESLRSHDGLGDTSGLFTEDAAVHWAKLVRILFKAHFIGHTNVGKRGRSFVFKDVELLQKATVYLDNKEALDKIRRISMIALQHQTQIRLPLIRAQSSTSTSGYSMRSSSLILRSTAWRASWMRSLLAALTARHRSLSLFRHRLRPMWHLLRLLLSKSSRV
jgi:hypothetical protein